MHTNIQLPQNLFFQQVRYEIPPFNAVMESNGWV